MKGVVDDADEDVRTQQKLTITLTRNKTMRTSTREKRKINNDGGGDN